MSNSVSQMLGLPERPPEPKPEQQEMDNWNLEPEQKTTIKEHRVIHISNTTSSYVKKPSEKEHLEGSSSRIETKRHE